MPNKEATTMSEGKSVRSLRVGSARGVCGVARLWRGINHAQRRAACIRSLAEPTRLTWNTSDRLLDRRHAKQAHMRPSDQEGVDRESEHDGNGIVPGSRRGGW